MRHADRCSAVRQTVIEFVDRLGLVQPGETQVVIRPVNRDMLVLVFVERRHQGFEVFFSANLAQIFCREVRVHSGAVPIHVLAERFAVPVHVHPKFFREAEQEVAGHPNLVGSRLRAFAENLEFPLALRHFGVDAFMVDACGQTEVEVGVHDLASDVANILVTHPGVVFTLRRRKSAAGWKAERNAILIKEILLFEAEPCIRVIEDRCPRVARVRGAIRKEDFAHHKNTVCLCGIRVAGNGLENAVRAFAFGLPGRAAVKSPEGELFQRGKGVKIFDLSFSAQVGNGLIAVQPDVFEFILRHICV